MTQAVPSVVQVAGPGAAVTTYFVIDPGLAVHSTSADDTPAIAVTPVGASGADGPGDPVGEGGALVGAALVGAALVGSMVVVGAALVGAAEVMGGSLVGASDVAGGSLVGADVSVVATAATMPAGGRVSAAAEAANPPTTMIPATSASAPTRAWGDVD
ncbi:hypothetical protein GCM10009682_46990 [Luedemannella flava]|uniref:Uncharacterized protein n=1 Tax=Luedemannella flava TaxID=349316 RepID=A0ABP4YKE8_9ACTN